MESLDDKKFDAAMNKYGYCPFKSHELSVVPCGPECAMFVTELDEYEEPHWKGCSIKSIAINIDLIRHEYVPKDDD